MRCAALSYIASGIAVDSSIGGNFSFRHHYIYIKRQHHAEKRILAAALA